MTPKDIANAAGASGARIVVVTGGEPTIFDLVPLTAAFHHRDLRVHLETSGAFLIKGDFDWITLSPKKWRPPLPDSVIRAKEFKLIVETPDDIEFYLNLIKALGCDWPYSHRPFWIHPEWSHREDKEVLDAISAAVKQGNGVLRAGWQLHKLYKTDALDPRSRPLVPLGGVPEKGF